MVRILLCCLLSVSGCAVSDQDTIARNHLKIMSAPSRPDYLTGSEGLMFTCINAYRREHNLPPLVVDDTLMVVARERVSVYTHKHPRFGWVRDHAKLKGFRGFCTDNIASGYEDSEQVVGNRYRGWGAEQPWAKSDGHDLQMKGYAKINDRWVDMKFDRVGVACYRNGNERYYIAIFGRLDNR